MKNLTIDVGNTNILFCLFENKRILKHERISLNNLNFDKLNSFKSLYMMSTSNILISSVVPDCNKILINFFNREMISFLFLKDVLGKINIKSNIKNKKEIGDDRLANTIYAKELLKRSVIIIDFGTATTLDVIDKNGVYDGGIITPGIDLSLNILNNKTAKLPLVKFKKTKKIIGHNTKQAIQSGFFWGYYSMINGLIEKIKNELNDNFKLILTGGNANHFKNFFNNVFTVDSFFTSKALNFILGKYKNEFFQK